MKIQGQIINGKLEIFEEDKIRYTRYVHRLEDGGILDIELEKVRYARSAKQNRFYFGVVVKPLAEYIGVEKPDIMHETLKSLHLTERIRVAYDRRRKMTVNHSTTDLDTWQFEEYLERIRVWAKDFLRYRIPYPNEVPLYAYDINEITQNAEKSEKNN